MTKQEYQEAVSFWTDKEKNSRKMEVTMLKKEIEKYILSENTCALATGCGDYVRCTPIEYTYHENAFWLFSEGGMKFRALQDNNRVSLAIYDKYAGFGALRGLQVNGTLELIEPFSEEYLSAAEFKKIPITTLQKMKSPMHLLKIIPEQMDYLNAAFRDMGYDSRQHIDFTD